jgi:hypothetical protein
MQERVHEARGTNSIQLGNIKEEDFSVPTPPLVLALARSIRLKWDTVVKLIRGCGTSTEARHSPFNGCVWHTDLRDVVTMLQCVESFNFVLVVGASSQNLEALGS